MNDSIMGRGTLEHMLQGGGKPFETRGGEKPSEVNYQSELNTSEEYYPNTRVCNHASKTYLLREVENPPR
jgi:hypothetical protein